MNPSARKNSQRAMNLFDGPRSGSNSQRMTDAGLQSMNISHYTRAGKAESADLLARLRPCVFLARGTIYISKADSIGEP